MFIEIRRSWLLAILLGASGACASNADIPLVDPSDAGDDAPATDDTGLATPSFPDGGVPSFDIPSSTCTATGAEDTDSTCADGVDNDCNGFIDCLDPSCRGAAAVCAATLDAGRPPRDAAGRRDVGACTPSGAENTDSTCADGVDNDCNGFVDCNDFGCSRAPAVTVCRRDGGSSIDVPPPRDSGVHRDSGVRRDSGTRRDIGPCTASGMENTNASCSDGVDNDCDGYVDCNDFNCSRTAAVTVCHDAGP
jgi:hypothetical protein